METEMGRLLDVIGELREKANVNTAFGEHRHRSRDSSNGMIDQRGGDAHHTASRLLLLHLSDGQLSEKEEAVEVG